LIDAISGVISGTATVISAASNYTVTATNTEGSVTAVVNIKVIDVIPSGLSYTTPNVYTKGLLITALTPTVSGGTVTSYTITPSLPTGLLIDAISGVISGTATVISAASNYTVTASNTGGSVTAVVNIKVIDVIPSGLSYTTPNVYTKGLLITALTPTVSGGAVTGYTINPSLPTGLVIDAISGVISGTATVISAASNYTVTASNTGGSVTAVVNITVNSDVPPQPQGSLNAIDYKLLLSDTVKLKLTITNGIAPFTLILKNSYNNSKDTLSNLTPFNNNIIFKLSQLDTTKTYTILKIIDANNNYRITGFTKDTTKVNVLNPKIVLTLKANLPEKQADNSFKSKFFLKVKNVGDIDLKNVQVNANLSTVFTQGINYVLDSVRVLSGNIKLNPNYTGAGTAKTVASDQKNTLISNNANIRYSAVLDQNYLFNSGVSLKMDEDGEVVYYVSIGATAKDVTLKIQFETVGSGVLVKSDSSLSSQSTSSKSNDGTNINQHPAITNEGLPLPTYIPLIPNEKIGASLNVSASKQVSGGYQFHFVAKIKNFGNVNLDSIRITYDLNKIYPNPDQAILITNPTVTRGNIVYNAKNFNGSSNINLFNYGGNLQVGDSATYEYDLKIISNRIKYTWPNYFVVFARSINSGLVIQDSSMSGSNPDPNYDNDPIEKFFTNATINYIVPTPPVIENKTYVFGSTMPANISNLVKSTPIGTVPVWCNDKTAVCSLLPPSTPSEIGRYIFTLRSYDTTTLLYSDDFVYDTIIIKPPLPVVVSKKYIIGNKTNPINVSFQVTGLPASTIKYFRNALMQSSIPTLGNTFGLTRYTTSQIINNIESDTIGFTVTMLDPKTLFHLQKIASEPRLLANSSFTIIYRFLLNNRTDEAMSNILMEDNLQNTFTYPTLFDVVSISSTGGLIYNNTFNGKTDIQLLKSTSLLAPNSTDTINLTLNLQPKGYAGVLNNVALLTATTPYGSFSMNSSSSVFANEIVKTATPLMVPDLKIDIPEAFSPNRDGVNDRFVIVKPFGTTLELEVFNRWGIKVYYNTNYNNEWDGRGINNFIGQDLLDGGYYYTLKTMSPNGSSQIFKGFVLIQR
jgi:gliding motility-associated-like protein/uncharacterized repeat protein (TIGR01451 family)